MKIDMTCYCGSRFQLDTSDKHQLTQTLTYGAWQRIHAPHTPAGKPLPWTPVKMPNIHPAIRLSKVRTQINGLKRTKKGLVMKVAELMGTATKMVVESDIRYENAVFLVSRERECVDICAPQDIHVEKLPLVKKLGDDDA